MMDDKFKFKAERDKNIILMGQNNELQQAGLKLLCEAAKYNYSYNFDWLSLPIIQHPQDIIAFQEIVFGVKPDLIIETGIARGGSLILSASLLALLDLCDHGTTSVEPHPEKPRSVIGIDIDIRTHNRNSLEAHPLYPRLTLIEGSSIDMKVIHKVKKIAATRKKVLVCLDSNHTRDHVLSELEAYAPLTSLGSYCLVFDTVIEDVPSEINQNRPWGKGNSPKTAVHEYLKSHSEFEVDNSIINKLLVTVAPEGYLKRIR